MVGSIKSRKVVDPKLNVFNGSQYAAVERDKLVASNLLKNPRSLWDAHYAAKTPNRDVGANSLSTSCRSVGFKEPLVAYHEENDPFATSLKGIEATPKDRLAVTRFLNTSDVEPVKLSSPVIRQRANTTGVARTVTQSTDPSVKPQEQSLTDLSTSEKYSSMSLPSSACSSVKKRHVAEILKQSQKMDVIPGTLAKLKETIKKQKENRSPNTSYSPPRKPFYNHDEMKLTPGLISHSTAVEATPIRKIAAGPAAPKFKGFSAAKTRLQTPDGKIWKEDDLLKQRPSYKAKTQKDISSVSKPSGISLSRNNSSMNKTPAKRKPVRKLGKIMVDDPVQKKSLITPSSWREGHKVAEAIVKSMSGKKADATDTKKESASTSTVISNEVADSTLKPEAENEDTVGQLKGLSKLSVQAKTILDDLNLSPSGVDVEKTESKPSKSKLSSRRASKRKPLQNFKKDSPEIPKVRHYDSAQVKQYMEKQKADRKRRQVEMKKREKEANEKRQRLLNDLDKRQKEARKKTIPEGPAKEKKVFQDTYTKPTSDIPLEAKLGYEERLAAFMQKLDQITKVVGDKPPSPEPKSTSRSEAPVSKFLLKLGECMQDAEGSPRRSSPSPREEKPQTEARPAIHLQPVIESRLELTLTKRDRIAALRAKSECLQERLEFESSRWLDPNITTQNFASTNMMFSPKTPERSKPDTSLDMEALHAKPNASSPLILTDTSQGGRISHPEAIDQDQAFKLSKDVEPSPRSFLEETLEAEEQSTLSSDYPGNTKSFNAGPTPAERSFTIADMMYRLNKEEYCAKNNIPTWKEKWQASSSEERNPFSRLAEPFQYGSPSADQLSTNNDLPPWKRPNGDKYSVMNVFTRRFLKTATPSAVDVLHSERQKTPVAAEEELPFEIRKPTSPEPTVSRPLSGGGNRQERTKTPPPSDSTNELIRWSETLQRKDPPEISVESEESLSVGDVRMPPLIIPPAQSSSLKYSPAVLEHKFALELSRYETIGEQIHQLEGSERTQGVALAQQETVSIAQILQSRQMQHELEMERLALKAKEKAMEASQKLQAYQMDSAAKDANQKESAAEEKRKLAAELHEQTRNSLQLQNEVARASIKALNRHRAPPGYRDTSEYSSSFTPTSKARRKGGAGYSTSYDSYTENSSHQRRGSSDEQSPTPMSEHSTTSLRPPQDEDESIREEIEGSSSSSIKEELSVKEHTGSSISEHIFPSSSPRNDGATKKLRQRDVTTHDAVHFDESMTEDEKIELSKKAVMPSESHRRQKYKKSPRLAYQSQHSDVSSDDISPTHNRSYLSGLDESILSSASLFGDADASSFNRFMNDHVRQYMLEEEVRMRHQGAMLKLREKALKEKTETELAWLELQKQQFRNKGEDDRMPPLKKKKRAILRRWQVETEEIKRLKAANKAASQDRELLKQQQKDITRMIHTTQQVKERIKAQGGDLVPAELKSSTPVPLHTEDSVATDSDFPNESDTNLNTSTTSVLLKKLHKSLAGLDGRRLTTREKALLRRKKEAEKLLEWKRKLDEEEKKVYDIEQQAMQAWNQKEKPKADKDALQRSDGAEKSHVTTSITEDIHPHEAAEESTSSLRSDIKEDLRVPESSSEETIGEEYSQSFASTEPTASISESKKHETITEELETNKSSTLRTKTDEASVPLLGGRKGPVVGKGRRRESLESWSDESFSQTQSETEQSDVECRVHALKEELKRRRLIADRLKKQQKKKQKEHLRAQEASLKSQIEAYDAFIKTTQQELNLELDSPSSGTPSILAHPPAAKPQIRSPRKSDQNRHISRSLRNSVSSLSSPDASPRAGSQKHPIGSVIARQQSDSESSGRSSRSLSFDDEQHSPDDVTTPSSVKFLPSQSSELVDVTPTHADRPKKLEISSSKPSRSLIPVASSKLQSSLRNQEKQLSTKPSRPSTLTSLSKIPISTLSPTEVEVDKDVSIATEEEVSERLSEASSERSGDSIPLFQLNEKAPDVEDDDDKTPVGSTMTTPTPSLPQTPTPEHPENLSNGVDVTDGAATFKFDPPLILASPTLKNEFPEIIEKVTLTSEEKTKELSEDLFSNLLEDSIESALSVHKTVLNKSQRDIKDDKKHEQRSFAEPKLTAAAQNLLHLLSSDRVDQTAEQLSHQVANELIGDTLSTVLSIRQSKKPLLDSGETAAKKVSSPDQEDGNEVEDIVRNAEEVDRVITRPVSPVFGASQDTDEWFDDDFGLAKPKVDRSNEMLREDWSSQLSPTPDGIASSRVEPVEIEYLVPHNRDQLLEVTERMVEHLYHFHANGELFLDDVTSFERFGDDVEPNDISDKEAVERTFRQSIYELARDLLREACDASEKKSNHFPWHKMKRKRRSSFCRSQPKSKSELTSSICKEVIRLIGYRESAPEHPRVSIKWGNIRKKDNVDFLLIDELREEEAEWTDYDVDEAAVKSQLTETVFDLLINDTISCFNRIEQVRTGS